ncbi:MAG: nitroreductase family deazaflavin-dependent oxidoreductase [Chloroflexi bacterium]|nr:MAG: nitroreductase family deazaflavin-dependent oxidoreductase [Chloroflexota bacterium]TMD81839.1 MAG: nitroreductase family deazaflavin-dependent oxidoreductase [Chloroflexota bacterium]
MCENYRSKRRAPAAPRQFQDASGSRWRGTPIKEGMAVTQPLDERVREALTRSQVIDMTTTGRKSREPRRIEIVMHNLGGRLYISGMPFRQRRSWLANIEANPQITIHLKRGLRADVPATAREITDPTERRQILEQVARVWKRNDVDTMMKYSPLIEVIVEEA